MSMLVYVCFHWFVFKSENFRSYSNKIRVLMFIEWWKRNNLLRNCLCFQTLNTSIIKIDYLFYWHCNLCVCAPARPSYSVFYWLKINAKKAWKFVRTKFPVTFLLCGRNNFVARRNQRNELLPPSTQFVFSDEEKKKLNRVVYSVSGKVLIG